MASDVFIDPPFKEFIYSFNRLKKYLLVWITTLLTE